MATYLAPGVYVEERSSGIKPIEAVSTSIAAFIGVAEKGPIGVATLVTSADEFIRVFGGPITPDPTIPALLPHLAYAVEHFFEQGGHSCYVVRTVHYDLTLANPVTAARVTNDFAVTDFSNAAAGALQVGGKTEGLWANDLQVQVLNTVRYMGRLASAANAADTFLTLVDNEATRPGDLFWVVQAVSATVSAVDPVAHTITLVAGSVTQNGAVFSGTIAIGAPVFSPDFGFMQSVITAAVTVAAGTAAAAVAVAAVTRDDTGAPLQPGDVITMTSAAPLLMTVTKTTPVVVAGAPAIRADVTGSAIAATLPIASTLVIARDFMLRVREVNTTEVLETHEHLSLVDADRVNHVDERLPIDGGPSHLIAGFDHGTQDAGAMANSTWTTLATGGNDGLTGLTDADYVGSLSLHSGLYALDLAHDASILCIPGAGAALSLQAIAYCELRRSLFFIADPPDDPVSPDILNYRDTSLNTSSSYAALYYPRIRIPDENTGALIRVPPSGAIAGVYAATDIARGVHKAPAGLDAYLGVATALAIEVTRARNDTLYQDQVNVIRKMPFGIVVWGARTLAARADPEWRYVNVRRLFIMLERSIELGTQWVTFEPNDSTLWKSITRNVRAFLRIQWIAGALVGDTEDQAFYVKCDASTNPPEIVEAGQVITEIGVAPSKPAEFVVFRIRQIAGVTST